MIMLWRSLPLWRGGPGRSGICPGRPARPAVDVREDPATRATLDRRGKAEWI